MVTKGVGSGRANTVKIDETLLKQIKELIESEEFKIEYPTVKQFVNIAVFKFLKEKSGPGGRAK